MCFYSYSASIFSSVHPKQIEKEGKDVTITAFSKMVGYALRVHSYTYLALLDIVFAI